MALLHVDFFSDVLGMCVEMDVILPEDTQGQVGMEGRAGSGQYPTLYLLHGMSDDHTIWQRRTSIERYVSDLGLAVVMPSTQLGFYTDMAYGQDWWTYISQELPAICRGFFPRMSPRREDTFAAGLSMGGYGALKLGLNAPDTFSRVASLSGAVDVRQEVAQIKASADPARQRWWMDVFGDLDAFEGSFNDLYAQAEHLAESGKARPDIFMWCGTEDFLIEQNRVMDKHLKALGYNLTYEESPGDHQWKYWDEWIQRVLQWLPLEGKEG